jgi:hypothetical protein
VRGAKGVPDEGESGLRSGAWPWCGARKEPRRSHGQSEGERAVLIPTNGFVTLLYDHEQANHEAVIRAAECKRQGAIVFVQRSCRPELSVASAGRGERKHRRYVHGDERPWEVKSVSGFSIREN